MEQAIPILPITDVDKAIACNIMCLVSSVTHVAQAWGSERPIDTHKHTTRRTALHRRRLRPLSPRKP